MPLEPLIAHIKSLVDKTVELENDTKKIPFSKIRFMLNHAINNYRNGLRIISDGLTTSLIKKAEIISTMTNKDGKSLSVDQVLYKIYQEMVSSSYSIAERFNTDVTMLVKSGISWEIYYWLLDIPASFNVEKIVVFQEGPRFLTESFSQVILNPLKTTTDLAENPSIPGSLEQVTPVNLIQRHPIEEGYIISCIRGEAQNPLMWPILCHEMFEMVDTEKGLVKSFEVFLKKQGKEMPILDADKRTNEKWILEIFMDFLAINSFGPMYAKSLLEFCGRSPYYQTPEYPEMCSRIYCAYLYLSEPAKTDTDIFGICQAKAKRDIEEEVKIYEQAGDLTDDKESRFRSLYSIMEQFRETIRSPSFLDRLKEHVAQSETAKTTLKSILQRKENEVATFIPFKDPLLTHNDIRNNVLYHHISLAIDPNILLNVVLANYDLYKKEEHLPVIIDSIKKWKIKQVWNASADILARAAPL